MPLDPQTLSAAVGQTAAAPDPSAQLNQYVSQLPQQAAPPPQPPSMADKWSNFHAAAMQNVMNTAKIASDENINDHVAGFGKAYDQQLSREFPQLSDDKRKEAKDHFTQEAKLNLQSELLKVHVQREMDYLKSGYFPGRRSTLMDVLKKIPGGGAELGESINMTKAAESIAAGKGTNEDYQTIAQTLARQQYDSKSGLGQKTWDVAASLPTTIAEYMMMSGPAGSAAAAGEGILGKLGSKMALGGGTRALNPFRLATGAINEASPKIGIDENGRMQVTPGGNAAVGLAKQFGEDATTNALFEGLDVLGPKTGNYPTRFAKGFGGIVGGTQAVREGQYWSGLSKNPAFITGMMKAKTPEEREQVLKQFAAEAITFGGAEAMGSLRKPSAPEVIGTHQPAFGPEPGVDWSDRDNELVGPKRQYAPPTLTEREGPPRPHGPLGEGGLPPEPPPPQGGTPPPEPGTGIINPVQSGVPGIVSGAVELPQSSPEHVDTMRAALKSLGLNSTKWTPEKVLSEAKRLGIDRAVEKPPVTQPPQKAATYAEPPQAPEITTPTVTPPESITAPETAEPSETPPEAESAATRTHIASYKDAKRSIGDAVAMLGPKGTAPRPMQTWVDPDNARAQQQSGTAAFTFDRKGWSGDVQNVGGHDVLQGSKVPLRYEPSLQRITYKGHPEDAGFGRLKAVVDEMNGERADAGLMKEYGHDGSLLPVDLEVTGAKPAELRQPIQGPKIPYSPPQLGERAGPPRPFGPLGPDAQGPVAQAAQDVRMGKVATFDKVVSDAKLTPFEKHAVVELFAGRSLREVRGDDAMVNPSTNKPYSHESVRKFTRSAMKKLGFSPEAIDQYMNQHDAADAIIDRLERGQGVSEVDVRGLDPQEFEVRRSAQLSKRARIDKAIDDLTDKYIEEAPTNPERKEWYARQLSSLRAQSEGVESSEGEVAGELPQPNEPASVRRAGGEVQTGPALPENAPQNAPVAPAASAPSTGPAAPVGTNPADAGPAVTPAGGGAAPGGVVAPGIIDRGKVLRAAGDVTGWNVWKDILRENYPEQADALIKQLGGEKVKSAGGLRNEGVNRAINFEGRRLQEEHLFHDAKLQHEAQQAGQDHPPAEVAKAIQDGLQAGAAAPQDEGEGVHPAADQGVGPTDTSFDFGANVADFLRGEGGFVDPAVLGAYARNLYERVAAATRGIRDGLGELGGKMFPATHRASRVTGEKLTEYVSARTFVKEAVPQYIDRVGSDKMTPEQDHLWGTTFAEERVRHAKADDLSRAQAASAAAAQARANGDTEEAARQAKLATQYQQAHGQRVTFVGKPDSPLPDEATYQATLNSPEYKAVMDRWQKEFLPKQEANFRMAQGLDDQDPIESRTQLPGRAMNMKAITEDADAGPGTVYTGSSRGNLKNLKTRQSPFASEASLAAPAYDTRLSSMIDNTLSRGEEIARKAEFLRTATAEEVAQPGRAGQQIEGFKELPFAKAPKGLEGAEPGDVMYFKKEIADDVRKAYAVDEPFHIPGVTPLANLLSKTALASTVEAAYHSRNLLTMLTKPGMNPVDFFTNGFKLLSGDKGIRDSLVELARIGALKGEGYASQRSQLDPRTWAGRFLDVVDRSMRLTANDAFDRLKRMGYDTDVSESSRRDFINQLGQYNQRAQNKAVQFLRDTGIGPFATAGTNYYMQGLRSLFLDPGVKANTWQSALALRTEVAARQVAVLGAVALINYLAWGRADGDDSTPLGGMKTGVGPDGKTRYFDFAGLFSPLPRGMRETGLMALAEGTRRGERPAAIIDKAKSDAVEAALHPIMGPPGAFAYTAATGKNSLGMQVAEKPAPGGSQSWQNLLAAVKTANPLYASLTGADRPGQEQSLGMRAAQLAGPYNPMRERSNPVVSDFYEAFQAAQQAHQQFTQQRQMGKVAPGYGPQQFAEYRRLEMGNQRMMQLNKAMRAAKTDEEKARLRGLEVKIATQALGR